MWYINLERPKEADRGYTQTRLNSNTRSAEAKNIWDDIFKKQLLFSSTSVTFRPSNQCISMCVCKYSQESTVFTWWWRKKKPLVGSRASSFLSLCSCSIKTGLCWCHSNSIVSHCISFTRHFWIFLDNLYLFQPVLTFKLHLTHAR